VLTTAYEHKLHACLAGRWSRLQCSRLQAPWCSRLRAAKFEVPVCSLLALIPTVMATIDKWNDLEN
jgi:hypothetical protein